MMDAKGDGMSCALGSWALAAGVGALLTVLLFIFGGGYGVLGSIFFGGIAAAVLGVLFSFVFCRPLPGPGEIKPGQSRGMRAQKKSFADEDHAAPAAAEAPAATGSPAPASTADAAKPPASAVKPSTALPGQAELAARKGTWRYGEEGASQADAQPDAAPETKSAAPDASESPGTRPEALSAPRGEGADDLKRIKGIGPKLETLCNDLGFYHFDQIANWTAEEVAWVDHNLEGFKGRVTRDDWVEQARLLASGGETDFSQKVDKGDVY